MQIKMDFFQVSKDSLTNLVKISANNNTSHKLQNINKSFPVFGIFFCLIFCILCIWCLIF